MEEIWTAFLAFWLAAFGAVMGSFLDCAASRWAAREEGRGAPEPFRGRSRCDSCGHVLGAGDLVPVFSFLFRRGRCRYCGGKIPSDCLWAELAGAAALGCLGLCFGPALELGQWCVFALALLALSLADAFQRVIPDSLLLALAANRFVWFPVLGQGVRELAEMCRAAVVPAVLLALVLALEKAWGREVMGGGDVKLLFALALYLTWAELLLALLAGCLLGLLWAAAAGGKGKGSAVPFGPFLSAGALLTVCFGGALLEWYFGLF